MGTCESWKTVAGSVVYGSTVRELAHRLFLQAEKAEAARIRAAS